MSNPAPLSPEKPQSEQRPEEIHTALLDPSAESKPESRSMQLWMHRLSVFLFVLISAVAGVLLIILPWTPQWTDNSLFLPYPGLRVVISNGFFRGVCSGLGVLDVWIGFWEALHYHEHT
jgi:hypothetical protein